MERNAIDIIEAQNGTEYEMTSGPISYEGDSEDDSDVEYGNDGGDKASESQLPYRERPSEPPYEPKSKISCDSCDAHNCVKYYRCKTCPDFDLCEACYVDRREGCSTDIKHRFSKIWWFDGKEVLLR